MNIIYNIKSGWYILILSTFMIVICCKEKSLTDKVIEKDKIGAIEGDSLYHQLMSSFVQLSRSTELYDSISVLILPVQAACPSCRKKTIDSIIKHKGDLIKNRFIILSGTDAKNIKATFAERDAEVPIGLSGIIIDSTNEAFVQDLVYTKPVIYYCKNGRVARKIVSIPSTIREDLAEFFANSTH